MNSIHESAFIFFNQCFELLLSFSLQLKEEEVAFRPTEGRKVAGAGSDVIRICVPCLVCCRIFLFFFFTPNLFYCEGCKIKLRKFFIHLFTCHTSISFCKINLFCLYGIVCVFHICT